MELQKILNELITTLEGMNNQKKHLKKIYKEDLEKRIEHLDDDWIEFYLELGDTLDIDIDDFHLDGLQKKLYEQMIQNQKELETTALRIYKVYMDSKDTKEEKIEFYENLKIQVQPKEYLSVKDFTLVFGYSSSAQKGFRSRLNNSIPFIQKKLGSKILYKKDAVDEWLKEQEKS